MTYIRHDEDNIIKDPQPGFTTVGVFTGTEGWTTVEYEDFNVDYIRHDDTNNIVGIISSYVRHDENNNPIGIGTYQRHDENNDPILD
jgi:hypothetical protein